jgi:hypothetical protein
MIGNSEDGNLYLRLRKMSHTIYVTRIILRPLSALFGLQFMLPMEKSVTFTSACANEIIPTHLIPNIKSISQSIAKKSGHNCFISELRTWVTLYVPVT